MLDAKKTALDLVEDSAEEFRQSQAATAQARERFVDSIVDARSAKATQQEIADRCVDLYGHHLSRQRVAQFIEERRNSVT